MRLTRFRLAFLLVLSTVVAAPSLASVPSPEMSTVPNHLTMVTRDGSGTVDPGQPFTVVVRDFGGMPMAYSMVVLGKAARSGCSRRRATRTHAA